MLRTKSKFSTAFQLLTGCQTESSMSLHYHLLHHMCTWNHITIYARKSWIRLLRITPTMRNRIDIRKLFKIFNVGDVILLACSTDSLQILRKLNCHVYIIDFGISSTFNIENLVDYKGPNSNPNNPSDDDLLSLFLRDILFHHFQIYYLIQRIRLIKLWIMKLSPPKMVRLASIRFNGMENHQQMIHG